MSVSMQNIGPLEASMLSHVAAVRRRLRGVPPAPTPRLLYVAPPSVVAEPVARAPHVATTKGRALVVEVAKAHGLNWREIISPDRSRRIVIPRNEVAFRLVTELGLSYPKAGRVLGGRDHTTILHGCRRHAETSPEAAEIWRRHVECETANRAHKRDKALRLHAEGLSVGQIAARLHVLPGAVKRWVA